MVFNALLLAAAASAPNVVFVTIDTLRSGHVGNGYAAARTANLDRLAREGVLFFNVGVNFLNAGQTEDAIQYFTKAVTLDPKYVDGYFRRGLGYLQLGKRDESRADFQKVLELAPEGAQADLARKALEQVK